MNFTRCTALDKFYYNPRKSASFDVKFTLDALAMNGVGAVLGEVGESYNRAIQITLWLESACPTTNTPRFYPNVIDVNTKQVERKVMGRNAADEDISSSGHGVNSIMERSTVMKQVRSRVGPVNTLREVLAIIKEHRPLAAAPMPELGALILRRNTEQLCLHTASHRPLNRL